MDKRNLDKSFDELYKLYIDEIYRFCYSKLNCDAHYAQDCTQEAFLVLYKRMKQGESFDYPRAFLYRTAYNFVKKRYDAIKKEQENLTKLDGLEIPDSSENEIIETLDCELLSKRLDEILNEKEKQLFRLRFTEEREVREISHQLGITEHNCYVRIMRLRKKIIASLNDFNN
ncbi:MAG: sigma-70 family RNA polymerase sigma factor [Eubacterium sp.]|nr:sigma-70 family RNA polymerase sigma factor [Eubacterium sp.]